MKTFDERIEEIDRLLTAYTEIETENRLRGYVSENMRSDFIAVLRVRDSLRCLQHLSMNAEGLANPYRVEWAKNIRMGFVADSLDSGMPPERLYEAIKNRTDPDWWIRNRHVIGIVPIVSQLTGPKK